MPKDPRRPAASRSSRPANPRSPAPRTRRPVPRQREVRAGLPAELRLPALAAVCLVAAIFAVVFVPPTARPAAVRSGRATAALSRSGGASLNASTTVTVVSNPGQATKRKSAGSRSSQHQKAAPSPSAPARQRQSLTLTIPEAVGQLIIATYQGASPPQSLLNAARAGQIGGVILMGDNTTGGVSGTRQAADALQQAARRGGNPGLLIMTDQEGGQVKRLSGPPDEAAAAMGDPAVARAQGLATGRLLKAAGVNMDLAPVADVTATNGFMTQEQRTFGSNPAQVAKAACGFAKALARKHVAYTLKHFPGLGDAVANTDSQPVAVTQSAAGIYADDAAYRRCGHGNLAAVMISSASYPHLTGSAPAVLSPLTYRKVIERDHIHALLISDSFESGAIQNLQSPALHALNAGLDMVMYPDYESVALNAYTKLVSDAEHRLIPRQRLDAAVSAVLTLKHNLGLG